MLVTFTCKAYADITMFGDIAKKFIKYMGYSGNIPSAIKAEDVPEALHKLRSKLAIETKEGENPNDKNNEDYVSTNKRALPLLELLEAAAEQNVNVMWKSD